MGEIMIKKKGGTEYKNSLMLKLRKIQARINNYKEKRFITEKTYVTMRLKKIEHLLCKEHFELILKFFEIVPRNITYNINADSMYYQLNDIEFFTYFSRKHSNENNIIDREVLFDLILKILTFCKENISDAKKRNLP